MTGPSPTWSHVLYLLDANVLITAHRDYYAVARVPRYPIGVVAPADPKVNYTIHLVN